MKCQPATEGVKEDNEQWIAGFVGMSLSTDFETYLELYLYQYQYIREDMLFKLPNLQQMENLPIHYFPNKYQLAPAFYSNMFRC